MFRHRRQRCHVALLYCHPGRFYIRSRLITVHRSATPTSYQRPQQPPAPCRSALCSTADQHRRLHLHRHLHHRHRRLHRQRLRYFRLPASVGIVWTHQNALINAVNPSDTTSRCGFFSRITTEISIVLTLLRIEFSDPAAPASRGPKCSFEAAHREMVLFSSTVCSKS